MEGYAIYGAAVGLEVMACWAPGSQDVGSWFLWEREVGVAESISDCSAVLRASRSIIFFWRRTTEVHFSRGDPHISCLWLHRMSLRDLPPAVEWRRWWIILRHSDKQ